MPGPWRWILAVVGVAAVIVVAAAIGGRDESGETVPAGEWAQNVCGTVGVWRGELEAIVEDLRTPNASSTAAGEEPQSETPQGRTGFFRKGVERAVLASETLVEGIDNAGAPDTSQGTEVADVVSNWADETLEAFEQAEDLLEDEADSLEDSLVQLADVVRSIARGLTGGTQALADVVRLDTETAQALRDSSTCQQVREETER